MQEDVFGDRVLGAWYQAAPFYTKALVSTFRSGSLHRSPVDVEEQLYLFPCIAFWLISEDFSSHSLALAVSYLLPNPIC